MKRVGIIGCGYVFDHYMATMHRHPGIEIAGVADIDRSRLRQATRYYGLRAYPDVQTLLNDGSVDIVANFTSIPAHHEVSKAALEAGKHVYSEKPFAPTLGEARELVDLAAKHGLRISCAPSNVLSATTQTMWKAVEEGVVGTPRIVYAEFDDNPVPLMQPEGWRSRSGAPWPYIHEYEMGSTWEHVGYHLTWMCAMFGPVDRVTAFSRQTLPRKTSERLDPPDTPDFSVASLDFASGVTGRVTCSIAVPLDHRMRIVGERGMVHADTYRHYECPVYVERFSSLSMNARKAQSVRRSPLLQRLFGVGGRRVPLVSVPSPGTGARVPLLAPGAGPRAWLRRWKQTELGQQDKAVGIAELAAAIDAGRHPLTVPDFILHVTELTLAIQAAGPGGSTRTLETSFEPLGLPATTRDQALDRARLVRRPLLDRLTSALLARMHGAGRSGE